jgi:SAM-dependent methyltransferase
MASAGTDLRQRVAQKYRAVRYAGTRCTCPCCGARVREFVASRSGPRCPVCRSKARHRSIALYVQKRLVSQQTPGIVLHVAPDRPLERTLRDFGGDRYVRSNIVPGRVELVMDVHDVPLRAETAELIVCSHVLEHVRDDRRSMAELQRVLRPDGTAIILVPIHRTNQHTVEDPTVTDPKRRKELFGQIDHVRYYGREDYVARLVNAGFTVTVEEFDESLTAEERAAHGLTGVPLYVCTRT